MGVVQRLASSPRKSEFVKVDVGGMPMRTFVVYPDRRDKAPVVVVIQEIFGLSDWIRGVADQLAADGFIAVAPDLLSGHGPNGGDSSSLSNQQEMTQATLTLAAAEILAKLTARASVRLEAAERERQERERRVLLRREPELRVCRQRGGVERGGRVLRHGADRRGAPRAAAGWRRRRRRRRWRPARRCPAGGRRRAGGGRRSGAAARRPRRSCRRTAWRTPKRR